jgi:hypothetical protein
VPDTRTRSPTPSGPIWWPTSCSLPGHKERDFRLIVVAVGLTSFGDVLAAVALTIRVHDLTGSGLAVAALSARIAPTNVMTAASQCGRRARRSSRARSSSGGGSGPEVSSGRYEEG